MVPLWTVRAGLRFGAYIPPTVDEISVLGQEWVLWSDAARGMQTQRVRAREGALEGADTGRSTGRR